MNIDHIRDTANRIAGNPGTGPIREFIDQLCEQLNHTPIISENREQQTLH
jgi:hypothetical protein